MQLSRILILALALAAPAGISHAQAPSPNTPNTPNTQGIGPTGVPGKPITKPAPAKPELLDINTASEAELSALPQIGPVRSKAIIAGRPYKSKDQLVSKNVLTQPIYDKIKTKIIAKQ